MGSVVVEDEAGRVLRQVDDPRGSLAKLLPDRDDRRFQLLRFVDPYQDTVFNQNQAPELIADLEIVGSSAEVDSQALIARVLDMARAVAAEPHLYLRFRGE